MIKTIFWGGLFAYVAYMMVFAPEEAPSNLTIMVAQQSMIGCEKDYFMNHVVTDKASRRSNGAMESKLREGVGKGVCFSYDKGAQFTPATSDTLSTGLGFYHPIDSDRSVWLDRKNLEALNAE